MALMAVCEHDGHQDCFRLIFPSQVVHIDRLTPIRHTTNLQDTSQSSIPSDSMDWLST